MADTYTEHLHLIKQDPDTIPDIDEEHVNLEILDREVFLRGKKFNGQSVGTDGEFHVDSIPYAENLATSASQKSNEEFIIRTSGGEASIPQKGDAWLTLIRGTHRHENYVPQSINMTVTPMARVAPPAITATIDEETFESYVSGEAGTYTISYTTEWDTSPTLYGLTVVNAPVDGDSITITWDGENDAVVTVNAVPRPTPESIDATIDEDVFVAYVTSSSTITLTYSTAWSADPSLYGITVTGSPIAGDVITVVYVKEVRGTIYQSDPQSFISTGWNLYNHAAGYARVIKYSDTYGFKISGTYTGLEFSTTITGSRVSLTPVSGYFTIPSDGYVFVSGGNTTDTALWMTWSDWGSGYNWTGSEQGDFEIYEEHQIDLSTFMAENFPYGLMEVGTVRDEINLNIGIAVSNVQRLAYNATNLASAKASGLQYEYDENYIYIERSNPVEYSVEIDGDYTAFDHGMELFTGTEQNVYSETIYGANLKNKLERDVLTISQQTLTNAQKSQARTNLSAASQADVDSLSSNLNKIVAYKNLGSFASESALQTALDSEIANMENHTQCAVRFSFSTATTSFANGYYNGLLSRGDSATYCSLLVNRYGASASPEVVTGSRSSSGWGFSNINRKTVQHASNIVKAEAISDNTNSVGLSVRNSNNITYFLRAREDGTVGLDKNNGSSWITLYELAKLSMLAGGNIVFRTNSENITSFTFTDLPRINTSAYRYYILVCGDPPSNNYAVIVGGLTTNNVDSHTFVIGDATMFAYTASVSNGAITFNFTDTRYGGVRLLWLS